MSEGRIIYLKYLLAKCLPHVIYASSQKTKHTCFDDWHFVNPKNTAITLCPTCGGLPSDIETEVLTEQARAAAALAQTLMKVLK